MQLTHHRPTVSTRRKLDEMTVWRDDEDDMGPARGLSNAVKISTLFWAACAFGLAVAGVRVWQGL